MQGAPKFRKVELILKDGDSRDVIDYDDCGMVITGDYIIIVEDEKDIEETSTSSTGTVYHMSEVAQYRTHK
jgi:hypothetical protein